MAIVQDEISLVKVSNGKEGSPGVPGKDGENGKVTYTWIKYGDDEKGSGITDYPANKKYIGFAYNKKTEKESDKPTDYTWSLIKGDDGKPGKDGNDGIPGKPGADGNPRYTWIKYSANEKGTPMTDAPDSKTRYIGIAVNKTTEKESDKPTDYTWSKFVGEDGNDGEPTGITESNTVPKKPFDGMLWINTGAKGYIDGATYQWNGTKWVLYKLVADNIQADTISSISANLGEVTAGNISGVEISGSKFINIGKSMIAGANIEHETVIEGMFESKWREPISGQNGVFLMNPLAISSSSHSDKEKNNPEWYWGVNNAGIEVAVKGKKSNLTLPNRALYGPNGISIENEDYSKTYGNVNLDYLDLVKIPPTELTPTSDYSIYANTINSLPMAKRSMGRVITLQGAFKNKKDVTTNNDGITLCQLPDWAIPDGRPIVVSQGSGMNKFCLAVTPKGELQWSRYGNDSIVKTPEGSWINISMVYTAKN